MDAAVEELLHTLLYEGYALYPYTPGATKNATPTPFGIVYPPAYAEGSPHTFDHARMQCVLRAGEDAALEATIAFLEPSGERHQGVERRIELARTPLGGLAAEPVTVHFAFDQVQGRARLAAQPLEDGLVRVSVCVHNTTSVPEGLDRPGALRHSLLSTHLLARVHDGRFSSPVAPESEATAAVTTCDSINTFPVLATPADDAVLGAAIVLPDHPQIAPESRGDLFDGTEIEEALLLHVMALSDGERQEIEEQDPAVRAMLARAAAATPEDIVRLHGRVRLSDPAGAPSPDAEAGARPGAPPIMFGGPRLGPADVAGESEVVVEGVTLRRGARVRLRPAPGRAPQDVVFAGHVATIERIYIDYDDAVHLGVTVDDDPGQELMRDIGRYLYFNPAEVEVMG